MDAFYQSVNAVIASADISYYRWVTVEFFSPSWLLLAATLAATGVALLVLIDRSRLREILLFGFLLAFLFGYTDTIATEYGLWEHKIRIVPVQASVFPFSHTMNPVFHMFAYQYGRTWRVFALLNTAAAAFFAFVAHPLYVWADVLWLGNWNHLYSFAYLVAVPLGVRAFVIWLVEVELRHATRAGRNAVSAALNPAMKLLGEDKDNDR